MAVSRFPEGLAPAFGGAPAASIVANAVGGFVFGAWGTAGRIENGTLVMGVIAGATVETYTQDTGATVFFAGRSEAATEAPGAASPGGTSKQGWSIKPLQ